MKIKYQTTDERDIDLIEHLWEKLNRHHRSRSVHFAEHYLKRGFTDRKSELLSRAKKAMRIDLARDVDSGRLIGYCISTILTDNKAEIDSIYINREYRSLGVGDNLMQRALRWMDSKHVSSRCLQVSAGNEEVFGFYSRYGFYPRRTTLEQKPGTPLPALTPPLP